MFNRARLKLTLWYMVIILFVGLFFSVAFYQVSTREIQRIIDRVEREQQMWGDQSPELGPPFRPDFPSLEELQTAKRRLQLILIVTNGVILIVSGGAAYFLAGKTLRPIQTMIEEQNQFISNSSHELRTPLATLRAEMEGSLLEKHISDRRARDLIKSNLEELTRLQKLSNELLQLAKLHDFPIVKKMSPVSLSHVLELAVQRVQPLAKAKHIKIVDRSQNCQVIGDQTSLQELFVILLDNAIKYSGGDTKVSLITQCTNGEVKILVKDQGIGIDSQDLPYIFDRFFRSDKSRSKNDGFGLGLSIARQIVVQHRGDIQVDSSSNKGTTFVVKLPLIES